MVMEDLMEIDSNNSQRIEEDAQFDEEKVRNWMISSFPWEEFSAYLCWLKFVCNSR